MVPVKENMITGLHRFIKQDLCYLKHLITIESKGVRYGYFALLYMRVMQCMHIHHADMVGSVTNSMSI